MNNKVLWHVILIVVSAVDGREIVRRAYLTGRSKPLSLAFFLQLYEYNISKIRTILQLGKELSLRDVISS